ncbi:hypothetical protein D3C83_29430 [compost metagenome]
MFHARADQQLDLGAHAAHDGGCLLHARQRHPFINVTGAQEHRRPMERARIIPLRAGWADESAGQRHDPAVTARMANRVLTHQAGALGKTQQHDASGIDTVVQQFGHQRVHALQRLVKARLV